MINTAERDNIHDGGHNAYLCIGFSKIWRKIHITRKMFCDAKCFKWMRTQISYHRFTNLGELIKVYFASKSRKGLSLKYFSMDSKTATQLKR